MSVIGKGSANGVDLERFNPQKLKQKGQVIRESLNILQEAVVVGFVGRLCRDKGVNELVKAFLVLSEKCNNLYLLFVGPKEYMGNEYEKDKTLFKAVPINKLKRNLSE